MPRFSGTCARWDRRAFVSANLGDLGFGPLITGALSDAFHVSSGANSIRYALVLPASFSMIAMLFFILASRRIAADAERAEAATREA